MAGEHGAQGHSEGNVFLLFWLQLRLFVFLFFFDGLYLFLLLPSSRSDWSVPHGRIRYFDHEQKNFSKLDSVEEHLLVWQELVSLQLSILLDHKLRNWVCFALGKQANCVKCFAYLRQVNQREIVKLGGQFMETHAVVHVVFLQNFTALLQLLQRIKVS